jgi:hypothetical protein
MEFFNVIDIELNATDNSEVNYFVLNVSGSTLAKGIFNANERHSLNIDSFKAGIYFIRFENGSKAIKTVKFIKK